MHEFRNPPTEDERGTVRVGGALGGGGEVGLGASRPTANPERAASALWVAQFTGTPERSPDTVPTSCFTKYLVVVDISNHPVQPRVATERLCH